MERKAPLFTVSEVTQSIKKLLESRLVPCWVEGEISNITFHSSGHVYFSLKDEQSQLRAVIWRTYRSSLKFKPQDGMKVLAYGTIKVYERGGQYQLMVFTLQPAGTGAMQLAYEQ